MLFGHLIRMDESADARTILTAVPQSDWRRPVGRPHSSWMATLKNDLSLHNLTFEDAIEIALDKPLWGLLAASGATHWWCMPNNDDDDECQHTVQPSAWPLIFLVDNWHTGYAWNDHADFGFSTHFRFRLRSPYRTNWMDKTRSAAYWDGHTITIQYSGSSQTNSHINSINLQKFCENKEKVNVMHTLASALPNASPVCEAAALLLSKPFADWP